MPTTSVVSRRGKRPGMPLLAISTLSTRGALRNIAHDRRLAEAALARGEEFFAQNEFERAAEVFRRGADLCRSLPGEAELHRRLAVRCDNAQRLHEVGQVSQLAERLRYLTGSNLSARGMPIGADRRFADIWAKRGEYLDFAQTGMPPAQREALRNDLFDLALIWADLRLRGDRGSESLLEVERTVQEMRAQFGDSAAIHLVRKRLADLRGNIYEAKEARRKANLLTPRNAWEWAALGRELLGSDLPKEAHAAFQRAVELQPDGFWPHFYLGICAFRLGGHSEAAETFRVCLALAPRSVVSNYNRGLTLARLGKDEEALRHFSRAIELDATAGDAHLQRALLHRKARHLPPAVEDLKQALLLSNDKAEAHYQLAEVYQATSLLDLARRHVALALQMNAVHDGARKLSELLNPTDSP